MRTCYTITRLRVKWLQQECGAQRARNEKARRSSRMPGLRLKESGRQDSAPARGQPTNERGERTGVARSPRCFHGWSIHPLLPRYPPDPTASTLLLPRIHASERLLVVMRPASQSAFRSVRRRIAPSRRQRRSYRKTQKTPRARRRFDSCPTVPTGTALCHSAGW